MPPLTARGMSTGSKAAWLALAAARLHAVSAKVAVREAKWSFRATKSVSQLTYVA